MFNKVPAVCAEVMGTIFDGDVTSVKEQAADAAWEWGNDPAFSRVAKRLASAKCSMNVLDTIETRNFGLIVTKGSATSRWLFWVRLDFTIEQGLDALL